MSALGPLAKGLAFLMGKQPEEQLSLVASWGWSGLNDRVGTKAGLGPRVLARFTRRSGRGSYRRPDRSDQ